jgi:hypothetical protein
MLCGSIHLVYGEYKLLEVEAAEVVPLRNCTGLHIDVMSLLKCLQNVGPPSTMQGFNFHWGRDYDTLYW